ncbi:MAG: hypothetical protein IT299_10650 [Dehalococcoidia bacterium]|nr:hypothetical protein [Dehalococcoidia bacterium]
MAAFGWSKTRLAVAGGAAVAIAATAAGVAYAQTPTETTRQQRAEEQLNRFAQNLGVDATRVKEAIKQTALQHIDEALAAGNLTAEQAQQAKDAINSGEFPGMGGFGFGGFKGGRGDGGHGGPGGFGGLGGVMKQGSEALATFLGVSADTLRTELQGKSLADVATAHGKSADQLKAFLTSEAEKKAQEAVTAGKLTQDQATKMLDAMKANLDEMITRVHSTDASGGRGFGPRMQRGTAPNAVPSSTPGSSS